MDKKRLKEMLSYNPETGEFTWLKRRQGRRFDRVGSINSHGYPRIKIDYQEYMLHVLAWLYVYGEMPASPIDHIDRNKSNTRISNLRLASNSQNQWNRGFQRSNSYGFKGITWSAHAKKWVAKICCDRKHQYLGSFNSKEDAALAYNFAALRLHGAYAYINKAR